MDLNAITVSFTVSGTKCHIVTLNLRQAFNDHHTFDAVVDYKPLDSEWMNSPAAIIGLIGEAAVIQMQHKDGTGINLFNGVVTNVSIMGRHGQQNYLGISGCSPTIKLEGSPTMDSFMDCTLKDIVNEAVGTSGNGCGVTVDPKKFTSQQFEYLCQYNENCFDFLNRLSWIYGEWFFYDGKECYFGKPDDGPEEELTYDEEITQLNLRAQMGPAKRERFDYQVHDEDWQNIPAPQSPNVAGNHSIVYGKANETYTARALAPALTYPVSDSLELLLEAESEKIAGGMYFLEAKSQTSKVKIGAPIKVKLPDSMTVSKDVGQFRVIEVTHYYNQKGEYFNSFTAIPVDLERIPMKPVPLPTALPQLAKVKENDDKGCLKVEFQWQDELGKTTNWVRVQTPDGGKSDKVSTNRGFVFLPEKDDIVMVGFEYGDPSRPYVTGSIYEENTGTGRAKPNNIKSITTRSGCTITFDDDKDEGSITISDPSGNTVTLDGNKAISISAPDKISLSAKEITISGSDAVKIDSEKLIEATSKETVNVTAKKEMTLDGDSKVTIKSKNAINEEAKAVAIKGSVSLKMEGNNVDISGSIMTNVSGKILNLN